MVYCVRPRKEELLQAEDCSRTEARAEVSNKSEGGNLFPGLCTLFFVFPRE